MQIDLSQKEIQMLDEALVSWQKEPEREGFGNALLGTMLGGVAKRLGEPIPEEERAATVMEKARQDGKKRELSVLLLRAKLNQAAAKESEFDVQAVTTPQ